ncbi:heparan-alpha-glucosaminide N-acetyltransferase [Paucibacter sp. APW11]|uniref:Heparan-alpha-glucosaminide N-acetyltransferase n=1 Tax=Roseateles aquae TaxID=3077235 RepID=A0ABU3P8E6_9BURK|nr:heparan-alpha-glucosaminide N-acetyltransferase [Paucibacter sp. APW11]MDT8998844.1 heparan-alpha-glucosaminide N-acetyltransferase [Paucibacter sp. APW11]
MSIATEISSPVPSAQRQPGLDALRGLAMVWMTVYHFCFDLQQFHYLRANFYEDPFWTWQRTAIVSLFLLCAGMGQAEALAAGQGWPRFWRRWGQIAGCALLVSLGSWWMFPRSYISFGVLHGMALMLLLLRLAAPRLNTALLVGLSLLALAAPQLWQHPLFDHRASNWVGLVTHKPITEDYVPVLPWIGVMGLGLLLGRQGWRPRLPAWCSRQLAWMGQHSLSYYMLHQPLLIGALSLLALLRGGA